MREVRRLLVTALVMSVVLPVFITVVLGLGLLLDSLGDTEGWRWCGRLSMAAAAVWVVAVVSMAIGGAVATLAASASDPEAESSESRPKAGG